MQETLKEKEKEIKRGDLELKDKLKREKELRE